MPDESAAEGIWSSGLMRRSAIDSAGSGTLSVPAGRSAIRPS